MPYRASERSQLRVLLQRFLLATGIAEVGQRWEGET